MQKIKLFFRKNWFEIAIVFILLLSITLRFYNYSNRWGLAYDQAHDAIVAKFALQNNKLPLLGPFSSAGPFQTGGEWYWLIMLGTSIYPFSVISPWIFLTFLHVFFVYLMILIGKEIIDKKFGLTAGLLAAVSTAQIAQSTNLTNQAPLGIIALVSIWMSIRYSKTKKEKYLLFLALSVGLASSIHLQGVALITLIFTTIVFSGFPTARGIIFLLVGLFLPWFPVFVADSTNSFLNIRNMFHYYLFDQYKISLDVLGRRWLTYLVIFWPNAWSIIIGGIKELGYGMIFLFMMVTLYKFLKRTITKEWYIILGSFLLSIVILRYTRTALFDSYLVFLHPFVFLLIGWTIAEFYKKKNFVVGILLLIIFSTGSLVRDNKEIISPENFTAFLTNRWEKELISLYPNKKFSLYDYNYAKRDHSLPLTLFLYADKKIDDNGVKIGLVVQKDKEFVHKPIIGKTGEYQILDLNSSSSAELGKAGWAFVNPSAIYYSTQEWYK